MMGVAGRFGNIWSRLLKSGEKISDLIPLVEREGCAVGPKAINQNYGNLLKTELEQYAFTVFEANQFIVEAKSGKLGEAELLASLKVRELEPLCITRFIIEMEFDYNEIRAYLEIPDFPRIGLVPEGEEGTFAQSLQKEMLPDDAINFFETFIDLYPELFE